MANLVGKNRIFEMSSQILQDDEVDFTVSDQDNRFVSQKALKLSPKRTVCYVLFEDRTKSQPDVDVVFRFQAPPTTCLVVMDEDGPIPELARAWPSRFAEMWASETGTPRSAIEPAKRTRQWGILFSDDETRAPEFLNSLRFYLRRAVRDVRGRQAGRSMARPLRRM